jgi:hypothetical protein
MFRYASGITNGNHPMKVDSLSERAQRVAENALIH